MQEEQQRLLALAAKSEDKSFTTVLNTLGEKPDWSSMQLSPQAVVFLESLHGKSVPEQKNLVSSSASQLKAAWQVLYAAQQGKLSGGKYLVTVLCELARNDASVYDIFVSALVDGALFSKPFTTFMMSTGSDFFAADKCGYLLTAIMCHAGPRHFPEADVKSVVSGLVDGNFKLSETGVIDALSNLLKLDAFRACVWNSPSVQDRILRVTPDTNPPLLYKAIFCIWMMSFNEAHIGLLPADTVALLLKSVIASSRVEKIVRVSLAALKNFMKTENEMGEQIVEADTLTVVQNLEYEKWRDAELYNEIKDVAAQISTQVNKFSSFERYERELSSGKLTWGFIHSEKFWLENVLKFDKDDFRAIKALVHILGKADAVSLAVACHDLGEFARLHPDGKKILARLNVKTSVMMLMANTEREVAREALLCVQKLMLNRWQEIAAN